MTWLHSGGQRLQLAVEVVKRSTLTLDVYVCNAVYILYSLDHAGVDALMHGRIFILILCLLVNRLYRRRTSLILLTWCTLTRAGFHYVGLPLFVTMVT